MGKKHIKKIIVSFLVTALTLSLMTSGIWGASSSKVYSGADCTTNKAAIASINNVIKKYPHGKVYPGAGQCWGYAEKVSSIVSAKRSVKYYTGLKFNKAKFKKYCLNAKAGTHLRLSRSKYFNAGSGHSIVLFKVSNNLVFWADNNYSWDNRVSYDYGTIDKFVSYYGQYGYINMIAKTTKYKNDSAPEVITFVDDAEYDTDL